MALPQIDSPSENGPDTLVVPIVVVVGGIDPSGGAGLLRDVATVRGLGGSALAVVTADTQQGAGVIHQVVPRTADRLRAELAGARSARPVAIKIGMAVGPATAEALLEALAGYPGPVVVDPVLATSRGGVLWAGAPRALLPLLRRATLVTPNAGEAAALAGRPVATADDAEAVGRELIEADGLRAVLVKGGHLATSDDDDLVADVLVTAAGSTRFFRARVPGPSPRGTGCALASAIAVMLGRGRGLDEAVCEAGDWLAELIANPIVVGDERHLSELPKLPATPF